jgi:hypothetical protein
LKAHDIIFSVGRRQTELWRLHARFASTRRCFSI